MVLHLPPSDAASDQCQHDTCARACLAVDTLTSLAPCHFVGIHCVQQYLVAMTTLVRDGASPALLGCCVRPMPPWSACVRASRAMLTCFEQRSFSRRATVPRGHDDVCEGWCFTCPPRMQRPTNVTMIHVCVRQPYSRHLHVPRSLSPCCIHCVQQYVVAMTTLVRAGASPALLGCCIRSLGTAFRFMACNSTRWP
jgi:hypothetical protein